MAHKTMYQTFLMEKKPAYTFPSFVKRESHAERTEWLSEYFILDESKRNKIIKTQSLADIARLIESLDKRIESNMDEGKNYQAELKKLSEYFVNQCRKIHFKDMPNDISNAYKKAFFELEPEKTKGLLSNKQDRQLFLKAAESDLIKSMPERRETHCRNLVYSEKIKGQHYAALKGKSSELFLSSLGMLSDSAQEKVLALQKVKDLQALKKDVMNKGTQEAHLSKGLQNALFKVNDLLEEKSQKKNMFQRLLRR